MKVHSETRKQCLWKVREAYSSLYFIPEIGYICRFFKVKCLPVVTQVAQ